MKEEWRDIPGYEGHYRISTSGRIFSLSRGGEKKPVLHTSGWLGLTLIKGSNVKYFTLHKLVASVFLGATRRNRVRHKNGNRFDNRVDNLVVTTQKKWMPKPARKSARERFWSNVERRGDSDCWRWLGSKNGAGYGSFSGIGHTTMAHRACWMMHFGSIPPGMVVMHKCDNRECVNPNHLQLGTYRDNIQDAIQKGRFKGGRRA